MYKRIFMAIVLATLGIPAVASASPIGPRTSEFSASGAFQHQSFKDNLGSTTQLDLSGDYFYAFTDLLQFGVGMLVQHQGLETSGGSSFGQTQFGFGGALRFNFGESESVIPYLEGSMGFIIYSGDGLDNASTTLQPGGTLGVRMMVNDSASFNLGLGYRYEVNALGSDMLDANTFLLQLGISVFPDGLTGN